VQHAALGTLQQDLLVARERLVDDRKDVLDVRAEPLAIRRVLVEHGPRIERGHVIELLQNRVLDLVEDEAEFLFQEARLQQVAGAEADAPDLIRVGGTDAAPGGAEPVIAALLLFELVEDRMPGHDQVSAIGDDQPVDADAARLHLLHLFEQHAWIEHDAVSDPAGRGRIQNAGGNEVEAEFLAGVDDRVPGVVAALGADHHVGLLREKVDDLALPLVAPLAAYEDGDHALAPASPVEVGEFRLLVDEEQLELPGRPVAMLGDDDLGNIAPVLGDVVIVETLAINEEHEVAILLDRVMENDVSCNEVMQVVYRQVVNVVFAIRFDRGNPVPVHVARGDAHQLVRSNHRREARCPVATQIL